MALRGRIRRFALRVTQVCGAGVLAAIALPAFSQASAPPAQKANLKTLAYAVVAIHPYKPKLNWGWSWSTTRDGFSASGITVRRLIAVAYDFKVDDQIRGLPGWAESEGFDIKAKMDAETMQVLHGLPKEQLAAERRLMLQVLLEDRFALKIHHVTGNLSVYQVVVAKSGVKLKASSKKPSGKKLGGYSVGNGRFQGDRVRISDLAFALTGQLGRIVEDKTGLTEKYNINLNWTPDGKQETATSGPLLSTALREQLGLKLISTKAPVDTIVVDHVEYPSPN